MQSHQSQRALAAWQSFITTPLDTVLQRHAEVDPEHELVGLFQSVVASVPAYRAFLAGHGFDPLAELGPQARGIRPLPFVYVFGRSDFTVSFFGANIYPENVSIGLEQPAVSAWATGKFVLEVKEDEDQNRYLVVTVELAPGIDGGEEIRQAIATSILSNLLRLNSEFANYVPAERRQPAVELRPTGDPEYFPVGVKHRYTRR